MTQVGTPQPNCNACGKEMRACSCYATPTATWTTADEVVAQGEIIREKYEVLRSIGTGATATVYLVRHLKTDQLFAMKMLNRDVPHADEARQRFEREATAISKLSHKNMVSLYDFGMASNGHLYFITDFVQGKSLFKVVREEGRLETLRACRIFVQICDAMQYAHQNSLIHRDLKPTNILLVPDPEIDELVRIVDFGIVKFMDTGFNPKQQKLTQEGTVVGSPLYMSPEQCQGHPVDHRADIYSLGCLMYEVLTGKVPFDGKYPFAILMKQVTEPVPVISAVYPELQIDQQLEMIVLRALCKRPEDRFQSMAELQSALAPFCR